MEEEVGRDEVDGTEEERRPKWTWTWTAFCRVDQGTAAM